MQVDLGVGPEALRPSGGGARALLGEWRLRLLAVFRLGVRNVVMLGRSGRRMVVVGRHGVGRGRRNTFYYECSLLLLRWRRRMMWELGP